MGLMRRTGGKEWALVKSRPKMNGSTKPRFRRVKSKGVGGRPNIVSKRKKEKSISRLMKEADALFSRKVRGLISLTQIMDAPFSIPDARPCFTCGTWLPPKKLHCGHYLSRFYKAARWNYDNARPQCMMCNLWKRGDPIRFRQNLVAEIGEARVLDVEKLRDVPIKLSREFLEAKIKELSV